MTQGSKEMMAGDIPRDIRDALDQTYSRILSVIR
jgi:hypothetical protein